MPDGYFDIVPWQGDLSESDLALSRKLARAAHREYARNAGRKADPQAGREAVPRLDLGDGVVVIVRELAEVWASVSKATTSELRTLILERRTADAEERRQASIARLKEKCAKLTAELEELAP